MALMTHHAGTARASYIKPAIFQEFFSLGLDDSASPFLTPKARLWAINLTLKASIFAAGLFLIAFILSFIEGAAPLSHLLIVSVYFLAGIPSLIEAIEDLSMLEINIDVLMTLAAFSSVLIGSSMEGALLLVLFSLSGSLEDAVTAKAKSSLNFLHELSPSKAFVIDKTGHLIERSVKDIQVGTSILVRAGEMVPLDGLVIDGVSSVSFAHLTGESLPLTKQKGDEVPAGGRNMEGALTLKVLRSNADSTLARIIQLVTEAQEARPALQRWFDKLSKRYATSIISLAALFALSFPYIFTIPFLGYEGSVYRALAFLIAASPCALIIAIPIAYLSAVSACAKQGILLKGGITLDALNKCSVIAFDKTGTLTTGNLSFLGIEGIGPSKQRSEDEILSIAYTLEQNTVHPIAASLVDQGKKRNLRPLSSKNFKSIPGYGIEASLETKDGEEFAFLGHPNYLLDHLSEELREKVVAKMEEVRQRGEVIALLQVSQDLYILTFQDTLRPHIRETIDALKKLKRWKLVMLTGDHEMNAQHVAEQSGVDEFYANLKPEDKLDYVVKHSQDSGLAMVGDGINDAPALARSTVGICMGKVGSATAMEAADVILLQDNLEKLEWLMAKAKNTQKVVQQNLIIATLAILIAAFPALAGLVPLWVAVVMHEGGTVLVGLNALRLLK